MTSYLSIFYQTKQTVKNFDSVEHDTLNLRVTIILILSGMIIVTESLFKDRLTELGLPMIILMYMIGGAMGLFIGGYAVGYTILGMSKLFKGQADFFNIKVIVGYSQIPALIQLPFIIYTGLVGGLTKDSGFDYYLITAISYLMTFLAFKILIQGLMIKNQYNFVKAFFTLTPFYLIAGGFYYYAYFVLK